LITLRFVIRFKVKLIFHNTSLPSLMNL